ncbi:SHOCT domain-containing protein [Micromonospora sp. WMMD710]|uniref:SHOCT domain-containing protein n=1 Tax=Micromonospora sp. WMMD710 TaxID=3016085 RepID=UPI00241674D3|nr:SHOCT domain-containing protein [Micromonospora sp. WMMD710]MDG4758493.1 SHOCT domain-containing protein [Micromonospora sp. WMMD710]
MAAWMWLWPLLVVAGALALSWLALWLSLAARKPRSLLGRTVLDERFARGEIDEDEYRRRRHVLS